MKFFRWIWDLLKAGWDVLRTVYWYNSLAWKILKSGGLIVFGFFMLSGGNLLYSFKPEWNWLLYVISYGFWLIIYGPIHHLIVIPVSLRLAHYSWGRAVRINKRGPFWTLIGFFVLVIYFGMFPLDVMTFRFKPSQLTDTPDVDPKVTCYRNEQPDDPRITCRIADNEAIGSVDVENNGRTLLTDEEPPYEFSLRVSELEEVVGQKNFHVIVRGENGSMIRRYVQSASMIEARPRPDTPTE
jgi:hypothetical protein